MKDHKKSKSGRQSPNIERADSDDEGEDASGYLDPAIAMTLGKGKKKSSSSKDVPSGKKEETSKGHDSGKPKPKMKSRNGGGPGDDDDGSDDDSDLPGHPRKGGDAGNGKGKGQKKGRKSVRRVEFILIFFILVEYILEWTDEVRYRITAANKGDPDETVKVLRTLEKAAKQETSCPACPRKFQKMDIKLALALNKIATGEYKTKLKQLTLQRRSEDKAVTGFQAYYLLLVMFNVTLKGSVVYDFRHLAKVKCGGDRDLQGFIDRWDDVLNRLTTPIPDEQLEVMFWEQVQCCRDLEFIWTQYRGSANINSYLLRKRGDYNLRAQLRSVADQQPSAQSPRNTAPARQQSQSPRRRSVSRGRSGSKGSRKGSGKGTPKGGGRGNTPRRGYSRGSGSGQRRDKRSNSSGQRRSSSGRSRSNSNMSAESKAAKEQGVCFDWLKGKCKRGDQCKYKHEKPTMPAAPSPSPSRKQVLQNILAKDMTKAQEHEKLPPHVRNIKTT
eukprot:2315234-Amphidinium_carterae.1